MGVQRDRVAAFRAALAGVGAKEFRMPTTTSDAMQLLNEISNADPADVQIQHPEALLKVGNDLNELGKAPTDDQEAMITWSEKFAQLAREFWNAFECQVVDGVEIVRKR